MKPRIKDTLFKMVNVAACIAVYSIYTRFEGFPPRSPWPYEPRGDLYGLAAKAISKSNMWSSDKAQALQMLLSDGPDSYYQSVIAIANGGMWSCDKLTAIIRESAKFTNFVEI